jgi:SAM-dependent methyltransferase
VAEEEVARTIAAYQDFAGGYADAQGALPEGALQKVRLFAELAGPGARILEIGSGPGRDAVALEAAGLVVDRTDVTPAFVDLLRARGHGARVLDPLVDDLGSDRDGVWAQACLLHVDRDDLPVVLGRLAAATRADGVLYLSLKEGDGEGWSTHGAVGQPRRFVYWRAPALLAVLESAGWVVQGRIERERGDKGEDWLEVMARRSPHIEPNG